jgi:hypothetical protein
LGFADGRNRPDTEVSLLPGAVEEAEGFLQTHPETSGPSLERLERVAQLVEGYESPYGMELLATVHWVAAHEGAKDLDAVVAGVHNWSARKRRLMSPGHIGLAYRRLNAMGWLGRK